MEFLHSEPAPPLDGYVPTLQPWIHDASNPYADWQFGDEDSAAAFIKRNLLRPSSELYIGRAMLMVSPDRRPVGCVIGMSGAELESCRAADFADFCAALEEHPEADEIMTETIEVGRALFPPVEKHEFYLSRIALAPEYRGRGLGRALVGHAIEAQRARGFSRFRVDVSADNVPAIRVYEGVGMRAFATNKSPEAELEYRAMALG